MIKNITQKSKTEPRYDGPFTVHGKTEGGSYVLVDTTGALLARNIPPSHIKMISQDTVISADNVFEVQAIIDHDGEQPITLASFVEENREFIAHNTEPGEDFVTVWTTRFGSIAAKLGVSLTKSKVDWGAFALTLWSTLKRQDKLSSDRLTDTFLSNSFTTSNGSLYSTS
ncbi:hypothetical protein DFQ30_011356 [Apophysomyces sp. BC1015]|nr:hypothetical protein DFQ30_011356 [Apophysomyces sp. BC1015]